MTEYFHSSLFIYSQEAEFLGEILKNNEQGVLVRAVPLDLFKRKYATLGNYVAECVHPIDHVVVAGGLSDIKFVMEQAIQSHFSVGIIPIARQKELIRAFDLPVKTEQAVELALQKDAQWMDIVRCNGHILLYKASIGWLPLLDTPVNENRLSSILSALKKLYGLKILKFYFATDSGKEIKTAASGCMIIQHHRGSLASKLIGNDSSSVDGAISLVIASPYSVIEYLKFLGHYFLSRETVSHLPSIIGYIKSPTVTVTSQKDLEVFVDGHALTQTPVFCETIPKAIKINVGNWLQEENKITQKAKESLKVAHLPDDKERLKIIEKKIPFFSYASEERFRDLFNALRADASIDGIYIVLMLLSTCLATVGLYMDSTAVIIGAMLLAPLMAPIVSAAMGLLRYDQKLLNQSVIKIVIGVLIALGASTLSSLLFSYKPLTHEMQSRLNPTLLDLAVAILSGVAAAYTKSHKEIIQSLAGVAIAVALVPPLSVAGIGIGRLDFNFFIQAFLLFSTNLVGIILSALFTFRVLGYSPVVKNRRGFTFVFLSLLLISTPLYLAYERIVYDIQLQRSLTSDRYYLNGKYIIIENVHFERKRGKKIFLVDILVRESLNRKDLYALKKKIEHYFGEEIVVRTRVSYIL